MNVDHEIDLTVNMIYIKQNTIIIHYYHSKILFYSIIIQSLPTSGFPSVHSFHIFPPHLAGLHQLNPIGPTGLCWCNWRPGSHSLRTLHGLLICLEMDEVTFMRHASSHCCSGPSRLPNLSKHSKLQVHPGWRRAFSEGSEHFLSENRCLETSTSRGSSPGIAWVN